MNLDCAKKLIDKGEINQNNNLELIIAFENATTAENFPYFSKLVFISSYYWEFWTVNRILYILDSFEKNLEDNDKNRFNLLYTRATVYLYIKDGIRAIQTCFKIKKIKNTPVENLFNVNNIIINALYDSKEYKYALEENLKIYDSVTFSLLTNQSKVIVIANNVLIYTSLDEYDKALWQYNIGLEFIKKHDDCNEMIEIFDLLNIFMTFKFEDKYYTQDNIKQATNNLLSKFDNDLNNRLYENISIYEEIFDKLISNGQKDIVYTCCTKMLKYLFNVYDISSIYRYLLLSISKMKKYEEYVSYLEKYAKLLAEKNKLDKYSIGSFYEQSSKYFNQHEKYIHDPLTKCLSRGIYEDKKDSRECKILVYLDLNNLKLVNDKNGHTFGDEYIKKFANNLLSCFADEYCFRIGGDEFVVVSSKLTMDEVISKLQKLNDLELFDAKINDKFSAGVVENLNNLSISELTSLADKSLYVAKKSKEDVFVIYND